MSLPESNHSDIIRPVQCTVAIRRDSLKLIHCHEDYYSIDFTFDANRPVQIHIYFMAHELYTNNNGSLSYVCCGRTSELDTFQRSYTFNRPAGYGQIFSSVSNDICFPLSVLHEHQHSCTIKSRIYPIVIVCREMNMESNRNSSTITDPTTSFPTFDQFHIVLATIKVLQSNDSTLPITPDRVSVVLLNQKHVYNGIVFKLFEIYGIENPPSKTSTNKSDGRRKKSLIKIVSTPIVNENEPFLNPTNEINVLRRSSSDTDISLNQANESTCVICLTDIRNVLLLPCRHLCICGLCAENLKFQSANCPICRVPFRALLQINALYCRKTPLMNHSYIDEEDELMYANVSLIDALNLSSTTMKPSTKKSCYPKQNITTNDMEYFCSEHSV